MDWRQVQRLGGKTGIQVGLQALLNLDVTLPSSDYLLKQARARGHLNDLQGKVSQWLDGSHHKVWRHRDPQQPNHVSVRMTADDVPLDPFAVLIGDVLHNLRGTLDYLVYSLTVSHSGDPSEDRAKETQFPIFGDKSKKGDFGMGARIFRDSGMKNIAGIHPDAQKIIHNVQPYHLGKGYVSHPLWVLQELSNMDKHRLLLSATCHSAMALMDVTRYQQESNFTIDLTRSMEVFGGFIEGETQVTNFWAVPTDPSREMNVGFFQPALRIAFKCGSIADGKDVVKVLREIDHFITAEIIPPLSAFL